MTIVWALTGFNLQLEIVQAAILNTHQSAIDSIDLRLSKTREIVCRI
ncbi:hypothetical protein [Chamaesiphon sp. VAR_69_metabat_338]|nr:hypothetical protein [Chamaesiphon sp. VAR_69_metabat_338]